MVITFIQLIQFIFTKNVFVYLANDGVISGGDLVEDTVDPLQPLLILCGDTVI